jgi:hypothetical protein
LVVCFLVAFYADTGSAPSYDDELDEVDDGDDARMTIFLSVNGVCAGERTQLSQVGSGEFRMQYPTSSMLAAW